MEFIETTKGKPSLLYKGHQYRKLRENKNSVVWMCMKEMEESRKACTGRLHISAEKNIEKEIPHVCAPNESAVKVTKAMFQVKKRVKEEVLSPVTNIFHEEISQLHGLVAEVPSFSSKRCNLNKVRRDVLGVIQNPNTSMEIGSPDELEYFSEGSSFLDADENGNGQPLPEITKPNIDVKNKKDNTQILISRYQSPVLEKCIPQLTPHETTIIKEELDLDDDYNANSSEYSKDYCANSSEHSRDDNNVEFQNMLNKMEKTNPLEENQYFSTNSNSSDFREVTTQQRSSFELVKPIKENNVSDFGDINLTQPKSQTFRKCSNKDPTFSDLESKCVNPEQKLRIDYLKIMIKKEKIEMENNREVHLQRMENLKLEHELLKLELENKKKIKFVSQHFWKD